MFSFNISSSSFAATAGEFYKLNISVRLSLYDVQCLHSESLTRIRFSGFV